MKGGTMERKRRISVYVGGRVAYHTTLVTRPGTGGGRYRTEDNQYAFTRIGRRWTVSEKNARTLGYHDIRTGYDTLNDAVASIYK